MEKVEKRGRKTLLTVIYKDDEALTYVGVYSNPHHVERAIGINNANIGKYIKGTINSLSGYIAVSVDLGDNPITEKYVKSLSINRAKERQDMGRILKMSESELSKLSIDQIRRIQSILDENKTEK